MQDFGLCVARVQLAWSSKACGNEFKDFCIDFLFYLPSPVWFKNWKRNFKKKKKQKHNVIWTEIFRFIRPMFQFKLLTITLTTGVNNVMPQKLQFLVVMQI